METDGKKDVLHFIINPIAGQGAAKTAFENISKQLEQKGVKYQAHFSTSKGDIEIIANSLEQGGAKTIIAVGGDGTFCELVNGVENPSLLHLGLIPSGTGNDFAKAFGIPKKIDQALEYILSGNIKKADYLQGIGRRSINIVSSGLDVEVLKKYYSKKRRTKLSYYTSLFSTVFKYHSKKVAYDIDCGQYSGENDCFIFAVCNGKYIGGGMKISPHSDVTDGKFNAININGMSRLKIIFRLLKFLKGKHINKPYTQEFLGKEIIINNGQPMTIDFDGEIFDNMPFCIKIISDGLNILYNY